ncbi:MAG: hypothetical protein ACQ5SW_07805 [Sphaerochaetaceae bacterium]
MKSFNGYYEMQTLANGVVNPVWVEYPMAVKVSKWVCLLALVGVALAYFGSLVPAYQEYGWIGVKWAALQVTYLIFLPITVLCCVGLNLKG